MVREVEATICSQCGEEWIDDATARQLEQIVNDARVRRLQVEVTASEVVARALRLAAEDSIELYSPERIAEFERAEKELEGFFRRKGLR